MKLLKSFFYDESSLFRKVKNFFLSLRGGWKIPNLFFLLTMSLSFLMACSRSAGDATSNASVKEIQRLAEELESLNRNLKKTQKKLKQVSEKIQVPEKKILPDPNIIMSQVDHGLLFLSKRVHQFISGLMALVYDNDLFFGAMGQLFNFLLPLLGSLVLALSSFVLGRFLILRHQRKILNQEANRAWRSLGMANYFTGLLLAPTLIYGALSFLWGQFLVYMKWVPFSLWNLGYGALIPVQWYVFWAGWHWVQLMFSPNRPSRALIIQPPKAASRSALFFRAALIAYFLFSILFFFVQFMSFSSLAQEKTIFISLLDLAVLVISGLLWRGMAYLKTSFQGLSSGGGGKALRVLNILKIVLVVLGAIWLVNPMRFITMQPLLWTSWMALLLMRPIQHRIRRYRLGFLWHYRHQSVGWTLIFLKKKHMMNEIVRFGIWGLIGYAWFSYWVFDNPYTMVFFIYWSRWLLASSWVHNIFHACVIGIVGIFLVKTGDRILKYYIEEKYNSDSLENNFLAGRLRTLTSMLKTVLRIVVWIPAGSLIFSQFGEINITTFITSIGAASFGLTFGFQGIVKDFITGFFIILENNLMVGDEVDVDQKSGKVEAITLRTLKIRADNGVLMTIPFGTIGVIGNKNREFSAALMNIATGYHEDVEKIQQLAEKAFSLTKRAMGKKIIGNLEFRGIQDVTGYAVILQAKIITAPNAQDIVRRTFNRYLKRLFDENHISVPLAPHSVNRLLPSMTNTV